MKRIGVVVAFAGLAVLAAGCSRAPKDMTGKVVEIAGSYAKTCRNVAKAPDGTLTANCLDGHNQFHAASIAAGACTADIANINGVLTCSAPPPQPPH